MSAAESDNAPIPDSFIMTTEEASRYLWGRFRIRRAVPTLRNLRMTTKGPVFIKQGVYRGGAITYLRNDLDTWAMRLIHRHTSTSERV